MLENMCLTEDQENYVLFKFPSNKNDWNGWNEKHIANMSYLYSWDDSFYIEN